MAIVSSTIKLNLASRTIQSLEQAKKLILQEQWVKAEQVIRSILQENPQQPQALYLLAHVALQSHAYDQAMHLLAQSSMLMPTKFQPLLKLAEVFSEIGRYQDADSCFLRAVQKFPYSDECLFAYAGFLNAKGDSIQAKKCLQQVLQLNQYHSGALLALTELNKGGDNSNWINRLENVYAKLTQQLESESPVSKVALIKIHHALALAYHWRDSFQQAFEHWNKANQLQLSQCNFRVAQLLPFFEQLKITFSESAIQDTQKTKIVPIFIVGMPRSGSTLLEQMLVCHPQISSAGEVDYLPKFVVPKIEAITTQAYPLGVNELSSDQIQSLAEEYLSHLSLHSDGCQFVIDKLPANFQSVGLISKLFPSALVIELERDPIAVGFSIYRNYFAENEPYFCELQEFVDYYLLYQQLMSHWNVACSHLLHKVSYQELVREPQRVLTEVLAKLQLEWHPDCLDYYQQKNYVTTLSSQQVRQPLYHNADQQWRHYRDFLLPLCEQFEN